MRNELDRRRRPSKGSDAAPGRSMLRAGRDAQMRPRGGRANVDPGCHESRRRCSRGCWKLLTTTGALRRGEPAGGFPVRVLARSAAAGLRAFAALHAAFGRVATAKRGQTGTVRNQENKEQERCGVGTPGRQERGRENGTSAFPQFAPDPTFQVLSPGRSLSQRKNWHGGRRPACRVSL